MCKNTNQHSQHGFKVGQGQVNLLTTLRLEKWYKHFDCVCFQHYLAPLLTLMHGDMAQTVRCLQFDIKTVRQHGNDFLNNSRLDDVLTGLLVSCNNAGMVDSRL